jgi:hypothetical protein
LKLCIRRRQPAGFSKNSQSASIASGRTRLMATGLSAGVNAIEPLGVRIPVIVAT